MNTIDLPLRQVRDLMKILSHLAGAEEPGMLRVETHLRKGGRCYWIHVELDGAGCHRAYDVAELAPLGLTGFSLGGPLDCEPSTLTFRLSDGATLRVVFGDGAVGGCDGSGE